MRCIVTTKSKNAKTGPIAVTMTDASTCPPACPFRAAGCYAKGGPLFWTWNKLTRQTIGSPFDQFIEQLTSLPRGQLTRLNQAGDLPGRGNRINGKKLSAIAKAGQGKRFFTYSHKPVIGSSFVATKNRAHIQAANAAGTVINLSGNNLAHADQLKALGIAPVVTVIPIGSPNTLATPAGHKVIKCPAQYREGVTCSTCKLCAVGNRSVIVGFEAHGYSKKAVSQISSQ